MKRILIALLFGVASCGRGVEGRWNIAIENNCTGTMVLSHTDRGGLAGDWVCGWMTGTATGLIGSSRASLTLELKDYHSFELLGGVVADDHIYGRLTDGPFDGTHPQIDLAFDAWR